MTIMIVDDLGIYSAGQTEGVLAPIQPAEQPAGLFSAPEGPE